ncbi:uncharacterized protein C2845_PM14G08150 [Panicum miliaceum]|uniref:Uncharacterized protein n=1 Tax=Panicum miliaceum TaxID=4540 RepID=A0A3L6PVM4_PANMI|nr:uncharacterized protein C2845_PM14G08150 [Panicum miliaceum]
MKSEIGGGKEIPITEHSVWCVIQIPNVDSDPPCMTDDEAHLKRRKLGGQICCSAYNPKVGIKVSDIERGLKIRTLTGALGLTAFFMCAFESLLFSNTESYIRLEDVRNTKDLENIGIRNWCKAVVDNLSKAITGCGIFLMMLEHLIHSRCPRCAFFDSKIIDTISAPDRRRDASLGTIEYGNLRLRSVIDTCYSLPPAAAPAPQFDHGSSIGTSAHGAGTSHDPGGHAATNLQPPTIYRYPSFSASFGQSIADVVGGNKKSKTLKILKAFDDSTN